MASSTAVIHHRKIRFFRKSENSNFIIYYANIFIYRFLCVLPDALPKTNAKENGGTTRQIDRSVPCTTQIDMSQNISLAHIAVPELFATKKLSPTPARFIGRISLNNKSPLLNMLLVCLLTNINSPYP